MKEYFVISDLFIENIQTNLCKLGDAFHWNSASWMAVSCEAPDLISKIYHSDTHLDIPPLLL